MTNNFVRTSKWSPLGLAEAGFFWNGPDLIQIDLDVGVGLFRQVEDLARIVTHLVNQVILRGKQTKFYEMRLEHHTAYFYNGVNSIKLYKFQDYSMNLI